MNIRDYFLNALNAGAADRRAWVTSVFSLVQESADAWQDDPYPYRLTRQDDGYYYVAPHDGNGPQKNELQKIEGATNTDEPLLRFSDRCLIGKGDVLNHQAEHPIDTPYGNVLFNHHVLVVPLGTEIPFQEGHINIGKIEGIIVERLTDDPPVDDDDGQRSPDGVIYAREYVEFADRALSMVAYNDISVQSITEKSLTGHPDRHKRRAELEAEYEGRLTDPAIIAKIGDELEKLDREWLTGDPSMNFYTVKSGKYFGDVRKKLYYMFGAEAPFSDGTTVDYIAKSLEEGIDVDNFPALVNSLREGSHKRGSLTQLGGESTKTIYRMLGTVRIVEDNCGTTLGLPKDITARNKNRFLGFWVIDSAGENVVLTTRNIDEYVGKTPYLRNPLTCKTEGRDVCRRCVGEANAEQPDGIAATAAQVGGRFLNSMLKSMHASSLKTSKWDYMSKIS